MNTFLITFIVIAVFFVFMAAGLFLSKKELKGSCGGIGKIMGKCGKCECKKEKNLN